jgi:hypothetical protein
MCVLYAQDSCKYICMYWLLGGILFYGEYVENICAWYYTHNIDFCALTCYASWESEARHVKFQLQRTDAVVVWHMSCSSTCFVFCDLFYEAVSESQHIAWNSMMIGEWGRGKYMKGIRYLSRRTVANTKFSLRNSLLHV